LENGHVVIFVVVIFVCIFVVFLARFALVSLLLVFSFFHRVFSNQVSEAKRKAEGRRERSE
jgi:F0F1-type ATP synthase membrane subunit b/b'